MLNKVTLYITTHNVTGKKYFSKTTKYFTEEDLQKYYHGSGVYWKNHLKKHGDDVKMEIYKICSLDENSIDYVEPIATHFSEYNHIKNSNKWANIIKETGLDSGNNGVKFLSEEHKAALSIAAKNKPKTSDETKIKLSIKAKEKVKSPHCSKVGSRSGMNRWHFNNCKHKSQI